MAARAFVVLVALIPAATAVLLYTFLGNFVAGHLLLTIAALAFLAGLKFPGSVVRSTLNRATHAVADESSANKK